MLSNTFYTMVSTVSGNNQLKARIALQRNHPIFDGHFPGHPVVPGVCMMQIVKEVLENHSGHRLMLTSGDNLKFLAVINPDEHREVDVTILFTVTEGSYNVTASIQSDPVTFFKFKGNFRKV